MRGPGHNHSLLQRSWGAQDFAQDVKSYLIVKVKITGIESNRRVVAALCDFEEPELDLKEVDALSSKGV